MKVIIIITIVLTQINNIYSIARREGSGGAVGTALAVHRLPVDGQT